MNSPPVRRFVFAWIALLVLLALSCATAFVPLGTFDVVSNYGVAVAKALIVVFVFMQLPRGAHMLWVVAAAGIIALVLLSGLSSTDFLMRGL